MFESTAKKALRFYIVNANTCDATHLQPDSLQGYDMVIVNANSLITNPSARAALACCPATLNINHNVELAEDTPVDVTAVNGKTVLHPGMAAPTLPTYLTVNGRLEIAPGCEQLLQHYCGFTVNGTVVCPESLAPLLSGAQVNGRIETYPDDCVLLDRVAVLDRAFVLRAKANTRYYASRRMVALDAAADYAALAAKGVQLVTETLVVCEAAAEAVIPLADEKVVVEIVPDGTVFVPDSARLDEAMLRRGTKLYVDGDLSVGRDAKDLLNQVEYLQVTGDANVLRSLLPAFAALNARYARLRPAAGTVLSDRVNLKLDTGLLAGAPDGVQVEDCINVTIAPDVTAALLQEKLLEMRDCVTVVCSPEQRAAIEPVARDVVTFRESPVKEAAPTGGLLSKAKGLAGELQQLLTELGIDLSTVDLVRTVLGSKIVNGNTCRL